MIAARTDAPSAAQPPPARRAPRPARIALAALCWLFAAGVLAQVYLAGLAVFGDPLRWPDHVALGHLLGPLAVAVAIAAPFAGLPRRVLAAAVALPVLFGFQYLFAGIGRGPVAALHATNALVLFAVALAIGVAARRAP